ncbi:hypothetical protein SSCHL_0727 [Staphylococcus schleiferi]|nr:hypothetical protein SSCHL_0727 [Staphylococcus schleiferi]
MFMLICHIVSKTFYHESMREVSYHCIISHKMKQGLSEPQSNLVLK